MKTFEEFQGEVSLAFPKMLFVFNDRTEKLYNHVSYLASSNSFEIWFTQFLDDSSSWEIESLDPLTDLEYLSVPFLTGEGYSLIEAIDNIKKRIK